MRVIVVMVVIVARSRNLRGRYRECGRGRRRCEVEQPAIGMEPKRSVSMEPEAGVGIDGADARFDSRLRKTAS